MGDGTDSTNSPVLPKWYNRQRLDEWIRQQGQDAFADSLGRISAERLNQPTNGDLRRWVEALERLPPPDSLALELGEGKVRVVGERDDADAVRETLMRFHPWRKGPFDFLTHHIDTEWRSDWKWDRMEKAIEFRDKAVLDVGCGNGYYGWRMLEAGAAFVLGLDPILRFLMQFEVFNRYAAEPRRHFVVPMVDTDLPDKLGLFDVVVSAGVLYHRTGPIDHLRSLAAALKPGGRLVLETLVVPGEAADVLVPVDRYAQMRNVWFLPSIEMLKVWIRRNGFKNVEVIDVTPTTVDEQRSTDWMTFQSLADFLDPEDRTKTIEGYPAPTRGLLTAERVGA